MNLCYLNKLQEYIMADCTRNGRSKCRACKHNIQTNQIRISECVDDPHYQGKHYYHLYCYQLKARFRHFDPETQLYNQGLQKKDLNRVLKVMRIQVKRLSKVGKKEESQPKSLSKSLAKKEEKKKKSEPKLKPKIRAKSEEKKEKSLSKPKSKSRAKNEEKKEVKVDQRATRSSRAAQREEKKEKEEKQEKKEKKEKRKEKSAQKSVSQPRIKQKKVKVKKFKPFVGYTVQQQHQFKQLTNEYMEKSAGQLKDELAMNKQRKVGTKIELSERCADGKILGQIPMCTACGGGRLRFDAKAGIYSCPGYMDDVHFRHCHKTFSMEEIKRAPWQAA